MRVLGGWDAEKNYNQYANGALAINVFSDDLCKNKETEQGQKWAIWGEKNNDKV